MVQTFSVLIVIERSSYDEKMVAIEMVYVKVVVVIVDYLYVKVPIV